MMLVGFMLCALLQVCVGIGGCGSACCESAVPLTHFSTVQVWSLITEHYFKTHNPPSGQSDSLSSTGGLHHQASRLSACSFSWCHAF